MKRKEIKRTGKVHIEPKMPDALAEMEEGDLAIIRGFPFIVIYCGEKQGNRVAAFQNPYTVVVL